MLPMMVTFPAWIILMAIAAVVIASLFAARRRRLELGRWEVKVCPFCGTNQPSHAEYCRSCGKRLGPP